MKLLEPVKIGSMELKNRMAFPPITTAFGASGGCFTNVEIEYMVERAQGGAALLFTDGVATDRNRQLSVDAPLPYLDNDGQISAYTRFVDALRNEGAKTCIQLYQAGRQTKLSKTGGREPVAPSACSTAMLGLIPFPDAVEMTGTDIEEAVRSFVLAASRAKCAGFDSVDIDGGAGYLIQQFLSPHTNRRSDDWGGSFEKRMRFALEVVSRVREVVGGGYPLIFDLPMDEYVEGGITPEDGIRMARMLEDAGIDAFRVHGVLMETYNRMFPTMSSPRGLNAPLGAALKKGLVRAKVMLGQRINTPALAERLLQEGACDVVLLGRALLCDPYFPKKVMAGKVREIRHCIACNTCVDQLALNKPVRCALNAAVGFEREYRIRKAARPVKVLVAGGGPAGMEAARAASLAGHQVVLCEKGPELGGQIPIAKVPPHKEELQTLLDFQKAQMEILGVDVRLNTEVDRASIEKISPDIVIVATGALPVRPDIPGIDKQNIHAARDVLADPSCIQGRLVVVVGGGTVGAETAEMLRTTGKEVTVLEMRDAIAPDMGLFVYLEFVSRMRKDAITFITGAAVKEIGQGTVIYRDRENREHSVEADDVVIAAGYRPDRSLLHTLDGMGLRVVSIGDVNSPRRIMDAIHEGFHAARRLSTDEEA